MIYYRICIKTLHLQVREVYELKKAENEIRWITWVTHVHYMTTNPVFLFTSDIRRLYVQQDSSCVNKAVCCTLKSRKHRENIGYFVLDIFFVQFCSLLQRGGILLRVKMPPNSPRYLETLTKEKLKEIWRTADAVCFDVDSTVVQEEGIDELAEFCGVGEAVRQW